MEEATDARGTLALQRMVRCNEALRVLLHIRDVDLARGNSCMCAVSTSNHGITSRPAERDSEDCPEKLDGAEERSMRNQTLIAAIKLLEEYLHSEKQRAAQQRSRRVCADVLRFFLFVFGMCAVISVYQFILHVDRESIYRNSYLS